MAKALLGRKQREKLVTLPKGGVTYRYAFTVGGVRYRGPTYLSDYDGAHAFAFRLQQRKQAETVLMQQATIPGAVADLPLKLVIADFWEKVASFTKRSAEDRIVFGRLAALLGPDKMLSQIDHDAVLTLRKRLVDKGEYAEATINNRMRHLRRILTYARKKGMSARTIEWQKVFLREPPPKIREITHAEEDLLFGDPTCGYSQVSRFCLMCGLRLGDLVSMKWSHVDLRQRTITLIVGKTQRVHVIPLTDEMAEMIEAQVGHHSDFVWTYVCKSTRTNPKSKRAHVKGERYPVAYEGYKKWFSRRARRHRLSDITPHMQRKTAGGRLLDATGSLSLVQEFLGHTDIKVTQKHYARHSAAQKLVGMQAVALAKSQLTKS